MDEREMDPCPDCNGECKVLRKAFVLDGVSYPETTVNCWRCDGTGEICSSCGESGAICCGCGDEDDD